MNLSTSDKAVSLMKKSVEDIISETQKAIETTSNQASFRNISFLQSAIKIPTTPNSSPKSPALFVQSTAADSSSSRSKNSPFTISPSGFADVYNFFGDQLWSRNEDGAFIDQKTTNYEDTTTTNTITKLPIELLMKTVQKAKEDTIMDDNYRNVKFEELRTSPSTTVEGKRKIIINKNSRQRVDFLNKNSEIIPTDVSDSSDSEHNKNITPFVSTAECSSTHEGRQLVHTILPINIDNLFTLLFSKSKFLLDFHAARKSTNMIHGDWIINEQGIKTRTVNITVMLTQAVGPKSSNVTETQIMRDCSKEGELYSIDINSTNAGIPYADSFGVLLHYCLVKTVDDHTMLSVHAQIKYKKSIWGMVKGFIEKNTWAGLEDFYTALLRSLQSEYCIPPAKAKSRPPRRGTTRGTNRGIVEETISDLSSSIQSQTKPNYESIPVKNSTEPSSKYKWLSTFTVLLLCMLLMFNVILLLKLQKLEDSEVENDINHIPIVSAIKKLPKSNKDWIELLGQQEILHQAQMKKWQAILQNAITLLKKTEITLENVNKCDFRNN